MSESERKSDYEEAYQQAWSAWSTWQTLAKDDLRAIVSNAWTQKDLDYMKKAFPEREIMSFPLLRRFVRLIGNFQRNNRLSLEYTPVENADEQTAGQLSACAKHALNRGNGYHVISDAFDGSLKTGMNLVNICNDRNANTIFERFAYNQFVLHPGFTKRDLSDCQYGILRKQITRAEAKMLFPGREKDVDGLKSRSLTEDGKFTYMPRVKLYGDYLLTLDEFTQRTTTRKRYFVNKLTGDYLVDGAGNKVAWEGDDEGLGALLGRYQFLTPVEEWDRTVEVTQYLEGVEMYSGIDPWGIGDFSFTPVICFFDPEVEDMHLRIQSAVRGLKDSQRSYDRRTIANLRAMEAVIGPGLDVEEGALKDDEQAYTAGAGQPRWFTEGAITDGRFRDRPAPDLPPSYFQIQESFENLCGKILNLNEDGLLGINQKDQLLLGVVGKMRMGLGMVGMFDFFDNLSLAHIGIGNKLLRLLQQYPAEKVRRIVNEDPAPAFYDREFGKYDAVPVEAVLTDTQRNQLYTELVNLKQMGANIGDPFPVPWSVILKYAPVALKQDLQQSLAQLEQQQMEAKARSEKLQEQAQVMMIEQAKAGVISDIARAKERETQAVENQATTALNRVKTAVEIDNLKREPLFEALGKAIDIERLKIERDKVKATKKEKRSESR